MPAPNATLIPASTMAGNPATRATRLPPLWALAVLSALAAGGLLALAFPPIGVWPVAFLLPLPSIWLAARLSDHSRRGRAFIATIFALAMLPFYAWQHAFMWNVSEVAYVLHQFYMVSWSGLLVFVASSVFRVTHATRAGRLALPVLLAILWTGIEYIRGEIFLGGFPFFFAAHPTIDLWSNSLLPLGNPAAVLGTYFVSFLVVLPACTWVALRVLPLSERGSLPSSPDPRAPAPRLTDRRERLFAWSLSAFIFIAGITLGAFETLEIPGMDQPEAPTLNVVALQTNVPQDNKNAWPTHERLLAMRRWLELSRTGAVAPTAATPGVNPAWTTDLIVWPETMFPGPALNDDARREQDRASLAFAVREPVPELNISGPILATVYADALFAAQKALGIPMLIGATAEENTQFENLPAGKLKHSSDAMYNSMFLVRDGALDTTRYDKIKLTPFGEELPFFNRFPALQQWLLDRLVLKGLKFDLKPGTVPTIFTVRGRGRSDSNPERVANVRIATPICYETVWAWACRGLVYQNGSRAADLMINASNDGWYGPFSPGRPNFLLLCRWRCAELNTPMIHVANTGISAHIDAHGRIVRQGPDDANAAPGSTAGAWREGVLRTTITTPRSSSRSTTYAALGDIFGGVAGIVAGVMGILSLRRTTPRAMLTSPSSAAPAATPTPRPLA